MVANRVVIPAEIYDQLRALADGQERDMPDYRTMKSLANEYGTQMVEHWLHNNMKLYKQIRILGMEPSNDG